MTCASQLEVTSATPVTKLSLRHKYRYLYQLSRLLKNTFLTRIRLKTWFKKPNLICSNEHFKFGFFLYKKKLIRHFVVLQGF